MKLLICLNCGAEIEASSIDVGTPVLECPECGAVESFGAEFGFDPDMLEDGDLKNFTVSEV